MAHKNYFHLISIEKAEFKNRELELKISHPTQIEVIEEKSEQTGDDTFLVSFKSLQFCSVEEIIENSTGKKNTIFSIPLNTNYSTGGLKLTLNYELSEAPSTCSPNLIPDTVGGSILVGTGG